MKPPTGKLMLGLAALAMLASCASVGPPLPPSLELPKPPSDLGAQRKGDRVLLTWTVPSVTTDRQRLRRLGPTWICRGLDPILSQCGTPVGETSPLANIVARKDSAGKNVSASYTDALAAQLEVSTPTGFVTYAVEALSRNRQGAGLSNQVHVTTAPTLPPPEGFRAEVTKEGMELVWTQPSLPVKPVGPVAYRLRFYRRAEGSPASISLGEQDYANGVRDLAEAVSQGQKSGQEVLSSGEAQPRSASTGKFLDQSIEWEKTYYYRATVVTVVTEAGKLPAQVEGDDTPEVKILAHDIFPPTLPSGLQAVFSGPGQQVFVDLIWAPVTDADLAGYNLYRREPGSTPEKLNSDLMKAPAYRDMKVLKGTTYIYSVSAVDVRGNESARSEEASESVP
jgi:hypothetical protein